MDLIPENLNGAVILNVGNICSSSKSDCKKCIDIGGAVHNWLLQTNLKYVLIDFQDEKEICTTFLIELLQLRKRLSIIFLFAGISEHPKKVLESYNYFNDSKEPLFESPEEAICYLKKHHKDAFNTEYTNVKFGEAISTIRSKHAYKIADIDDDIDDDDDDDDDKSDDDSDF